VVLVSDGGAVVAVVGDADEVGVGIAAVGGGPVGGQVITGAAVGEVRVVPFNDAVERVVVVGGCSGTDELIEGVEGVVGGQESMLLSRSPSPLVTVNGYRGNSSATRLWGKPERGCRYFGSRELDMRAGSVFGLPSGRPG
jgi:hypothetical protein